MERTDRRDRLVDELVSLIESGQSHPEWSALIDRLREIVHTTPRDGRPILRVRCFGQLAFGSPTGWIPGPSPKKGREFLEYLVAYPKSVVSRETLAETFWPDLDAQATAHRLHVAASAARSFVRDLLSGQDAILCTAGGYGWAPDIIVDTDLQRFLALGREQSADAMKAGVRLYQGELFGGEGSDWVQPLRVRCAASYVLMLERLADAALGYGEHSEALEYGLELLSADRGHEGASRLVMRCFAALGRRGRALAEYEALRAFLRKHLGLEPTAETTNLVRAIMEGDPDHQKTTNHTTA